MVSGCSKITELSSLLMGSSTINLLGVKALVQNIQIMKKKALFQRLLPNPKWCRLSEWLNIKHASSQTSSFLINPNDVVSVVLELSVIEALCYLTCGVLLLHG